MIDGERRNKLVLILAVNPHSGSGKAPKYAQYAHKVFTQSGIEVLVIEGVSLEDFRNRFRKALQEQDISGVVAFGGDGFVHEIMQHIAQSPIPLGVIPCGTGNDFARTLNVQRLSLDQQISLIINTAAQRHDLGRIGSRWFAAILSSGFDAVVNERANQMLWPKGRMKYNLAMVEKLIQLKSHPFEVTMDGVEHSFNATLVTVANGSSYGGGMQVCPDASTHDGLFDVMVLKKVGRLELLKVFPRVYKGTHVSHPAVSIYRCREISVVGSGSAYADGEKVSQLPYTAETIPGALLAWSA